MFEIFIEPVIESGRIRYRYILYILFRGTGTGGGYEPCLSSRIQATTMTFFLHLCNMQYTLCTAHALLKQKILAVVISTFYSNKSYTVYTLIT